jgi:hypothetical protein
MQIHTRWVGTDGLDLFTADLGPSQALGDFYWGRMWRLVSEELPERDWLDSGWQGIPGYPPFSSEVALYEVRPTTDNQRLRAVVGAASAYPINTARVLQRIRAVFRARQVRFVEVGTNLTL